MMQFLRDKSTKFKILLGFFSVISINFVIVAISIYALNLSRDAALMIDETLSTAFQRVQRVDTCFENANQKISKGLNLLDKDYTPDDLKRDLPNIINRLRQSISSLNDDFIAHPDYRSANQQLRTAANGYIRQVEDQILPMMDSDMADFALSLYVRDALPLWTTARNCTARINDLQTRRCIELSAAAADPRNIYYMYGLTAFGVLVSLIMSWYIARYFSNNLQAYTNQLELMAAGDFTNQVKVNSKDEFGRASVALNKLRTSISEIIVLTVNECDKLYDRLSSVNDSSRVIANATDNVQNQAMTVATASDEMVSTTEDIARNCERAAAGSNECTSITHEGLALTSRAFENVQRQVEHTKDNSSKIEQLAAKSRDITSIVSTIDDIASQTNLLALNAAIEAARSGDAGRGFAVVADEVRSLAIRTAQSTHEISRMVDTIQSYARSATESINVSVEHMDNVAQDAKDLESLLNNITSRVNEVNVQITQIAASAEMQTAATGEISNNAQNVTNASSEMTEHASKQAHSIEETIEDVRILHRELEFFKISPEFIGTAGSAHA